MLMLHHRNIELELGLSVVCSSLIGMRCTSVPAQGKVVVPSGCQCCPDGKIWFRQLSSCISTIVLVVGVPSSSRNYNA